ncbi:MAG: hypothetical protein U0263_02555 [Polyangiaceae bacterium]
MPFRDDREAQRARLEALESELQEARADAEAARRDRDRLAAELVEERQQNQDEPEELVDEAVRERRRELEARERTEKQRARERAARPRGAREPLAVAWNLRRGTHIGLLITGGMGWLAFASFGQTLRRDDILPGERLAMQWTLVGALVAALLGSVLLPWSLWSLMRFREKLPLDFDAVGWGKLVDPSQFENLEMWRHVVVSVEGDAPESLKAALEKLGDRANATFHSADDPSRDERIRWQVKGTRARGSANRATALALVHWCRRDLADVARSSTSRLRVEFSVADESLWVSAPSD